MSIPNLQNRIPQHLFLLSSSHHLLFLTQPRLICYTLTNETRRKLQHSNDSGHAGSLKYQKKLRCASGNAVSLK